MLSFLLRRLLEALLVLLLVAALAFGLFQFVGDPVAQMLGQDASPAQRAALRASLGLDEPLPQQYLHFITQAVKGEFGLSLRHGRPVAEILAERLPATLELAGAAALLALLIGLPLGMLAAIHPRSRLLRLAMGLTLFGISLPSFMLGMLLILVFTLQLGWLPGFGRGPVPEGGSSSLGSLAGWRHLLLPALTLALFQTALIARLVRAEMQQVLASEHIRYARARGLPAWRLHGRHALRSALTPVITIASLQLGSLIAFSIVTESVFQWPGLGLLFIQAVAYADIPVMAAYLCGSAALFVLLNLLADLLCRLVDPRLRRLLGGGAA